VLKSEGNNRDTAVWIKMAAHDIMLGWAHSLPKSPQIHITKKSELPRR
jgi:hypothetical protein